ncbi:hypothetical protein HBB16_17270 [Pseudonocardia sp. MCCB 268]|nr:hypothetical protein [Pseudonocardia cytotoxica]
METSEDRERRVLTPAFFTIAGSWLRSSTSRSATWRPARDHCRLVNQREPPALLPHLPTTEDDGPGDLRYAHLR